MRGIRFTAPDKYDKFLYYIFESVPFDQYTWYVDQTEIIYYDKAIQKASEDFFDSRIMSGHDFKLAISKEDYYVYLANIQAYSVYSPYCVILTYEDFLKSDCELILICADTVDYNIYCKNQELLTQMYIACKGLFRDVEYITDENDSRTVLRI